MVSFPCLKPLDAETVRSLGRRFAHLITVEENTVIGGFGSAVCEMIAEEGTAARVHRVGLDDCYATVVGDQQYLRESYGMDAGSIAKRAEKWLRN